MPAVPEPKESAVEAPIVVDLGKKKRRQIKRLRKGTGKLLTEVQDCIDELKTAGKISGAARPIIMVVREKRKRQGLRLPKF